jgi:hypothetical protein
MKGRAESSTGGRGSCQKSGIRNQEGIGKRSDQKCCQIECEGIDNQTVVDDHRDCWNNMVQKLMYLEKFRWNKE